MGVDDLGIDTLEVDTLGIDDLGVDTLEVDTLGVDIEDFIDRIGILGKYRKNRYFLFLWLY